MDLSTDLCFREIKKSKRVPKFQTNLERSPGQRLTGVQIDQIGFQGPNLTPPKWHMRFTHYTCNSGAWRCDPYTIRVRLAHPRQTSLYVIGLHLTLTVCCTYLCIKVVDTQARDSPATLHPAFKERTKERPTHRQTERQTERHKGRKQERKKNNKEQNKETNTEGSKTK